MKQEFDRTVYYVDRKPRFLTWKGLVCVLLALAVLAGCGFAYRHALASEIEAINSSSETAEKQLLEKSAAQGEPVSIAPDLRKRAVADVIEDQSIPAYSYDECWSLDVSKPSGVTLADLQLVSRGAFVGIEDAMKAHAKVNVAIASRFISAVFICSYSFTCQRYGESYFMPRSFKRSGPTTRRMWPS